MGKGGAGTCMLQTTREANKSMHAQGDEGKIIGTRGGDVLMLMARRITPFGQQGRAVHCAGMRMRRRHDTGRVCVLAAVVRTCRGYRLGARGGG